MRIRSPEAWAYVAVIGLIVVYKVCVLGFHPLDTDECGHLSFTWSTIHGTHHSMCYAHLMPPLYRELLRPLVMVFGDRFATVTAARVLSLLFSLATLHQLYAYTREQHGQRAAWVVPVVFALTFYSARGGVEARPDAAQMLCYVIALRWIVRLNVTAELWRWLVLGTVVGLATLFKQTGFVFGAALAAYFLVNHQAHLRSWGSVGRLVTAAAVAVVPIVALWGVAAWTTGCPGEFLGQALWNEPHLHGEGVRDYSSLVWAVTHGPLPFLLPLAWALAVAHSWRREQDLARVSWRSPALFVAAYVAVDTFAAVDYGESHLLQFALVLALFAAPVVGWLGSAAPRAAAGLCLALVAAMAVNAAIYEPLRQRLYPPNEHLERQRATIEFLLEHTPPDGPVLGSYPMWMFRSGGDTINPPDLSDCFIVDHSGSHGNLSEETLTEVFASEQAVFVVVDDWMLETMHRVPEIRDIVEQQYGLWCLTQGRTMLGIHRQRGTAVPRDGLVHFDHRGLRDSAACTWGRE